ncbi:orc1/cdc6 family replication initiation protein [Candidatus Hecatella orcuttiae]|uniref:Cdc6/Cdc18 family protein n=1 Tax=Candidatus Hecatella orcuttiae TaxID=1935119 RepID=UPI002867C759|nr:orc1/cdc6 family replication initiation protein [Candidatus Hecatella orcuttiae]
MSVDKLEQLFEKYAGESSIFVNREVLRHDFVPKELPHREKEILRFASILAPSLKKMKCSNLFAYGKTGTGKTAVTRYVLERLVKKSEKRGEKVRICYTNCRAAGTEYRVVSNMCSAVGVSIPFTGLSVAEALDRFKEGLNDARCAFIVALDEVDTLVKEHGDRLLYKLTRINEELKSSSLTTIGISNDLYFKDMLDARVLSSLSEEEMVFKPYSAEQIRDILQQRVKLAFRNGSLPSATLNLCAALAAAEHGDARRALDLVRVAGEVAERDGASVVTEEHVRDAQRKIEHDRVLEVLNSLPLHSKLILFVLYEKKQTAREGLFSGELYEAYEELSQRIGVEALTQRRISGLLNELDMLGAVNAKIASLGRYGRTKKIRLKVPFSTLERIFREDLHLKGFIK